MNKMIYILSILALSETLVAQKDVSKVSADAVAGILDRNTHIDDEDLSEPQESVVDFGPSFPFADMDLISRGNTMRDMKSRSRENAHKAFIRSQFQALGIRYADQIKKQYDLDFFDRKYVRSFESFLQRIQNQNLTLGEIQGMSPIDLLNRLDFVWDDIHMSFVYIIQKEIEHSIEELCIMFAPLCPDDTTEQVFEDILREKLLERSIEVIVMVIENDQINFLEWALDKLLDTRNVEWPLTFALGSYEFATNMMSGKANDTDEFRVTDLQNVLSHLDPDLQKKLGANIFTLHQILNEEIDKEYTRSDTLPDMPDMQDNQEELNIFFAKVQDELETFCKPEWILEEALYKDKKLIQVFLENGKKDTSSILDELTPKERIRLYSLFLTASEESEDEYKQGEAKILLRMYISHLFFEHHREYHFGKLTSHVQDQLLGIIIEGLPIIRNLRGGKDDPFEPLIHQIKWAIDPFKDITLWFLVANLLWIVALIVAPHLIPSTQKKVVEAENKFLIDPIFRTFFFWFFRIGMKPEARRLYEGADWWNASSSEYDDAQLAELFCIPQKLLGSNESTVSRLRLYCVRALNSTGNWMKPGARTIIGATKIKIVNLYVHILDDIWLRDDTPLSEDDTQDRLPKVMTDYNLDSENDDDIHEAKTLIQTEHELKKLRNIMIWFQLDNTNEEDIEKWRKIFTAAQDLIRKLCGMNLNEMAEAGSNATERIGGIHSAQKSSDGYKAVIKFLKYCQKLTNRKAIQPNIQPTFLPALELLVKVIQQRGDMASTLQRTIDEEELKAAYGDEEESFDL